MPRFYFNIRDDMTLNADPEGSVFTSLEQARQEAVLAAREMIAAKVIAGDVIDAQMLEITDEDGAIVEKLAMRSVLRLE